MIWVAWSLERCFQILYCESCSIFLYSLILLVVVVIRYFYSEILIPFCRWFGGNICEYLIRSLLGYLIQESSWINSLRRTIWHSSRIKCLLKHDVKVYPLEQSDSYNLFAWGCFQIIVSIRWISVVLETVADIWYNELQKIIEVLMWSLTSLSSEYVVERSITLYVNFSLAAEFFF